MSEIVFLGYEFRCGIPGSDCLVQLQCMVFTAGGGSEGVKHHTVLFLVIFKKCVLEDVWGLGVDSGVWGEGLC